MLGHNPPDRKDACLLRNFSNQGTNVVVSFGMLQYEVASVKQFDANRICSELNAEQQASRRCDLRADCEKLANGGEKCFGELANCSPTLPVYARTRFKF